MDCREILELLPLYIEGELEKNEEKAVKEHLQSCKTCAEELKFLESILNEAGKLPETTPSENFHTSLKEKLKTVKQVKIINSRKTFKMFTAAAASAAVIAVSITALNTEFYKLNNSALNDNKSEMTETIKESSETALEKEEVAEVEKVLNEPEREKIQAEKTQKTEVKKDVAVKSTKNEQPLSEKVQKEENKPTLEDKKEENLENAENGIQTASQVNENAAFDAEEGVDEALVAAEEKGVSEEIAMTEEKTVSGGGGGSSGGARSFKMAPRFDKTVLNVKIPEGDLSIMELLENYTNENREYKIPLEDFYNLADKIFAVPDCEAYYANENMTEEYQKLAENDERKAQIEEICRFGYVVIIEN